MAVKKMSDYLSAATADYMGVVLNVNPQQVLTETGSKKQFVHEADDGSEERISLSNDTIFFITLLWDYLTASESGTIFDLYHDSAKANGILKTFRWDHPDPNDAGRYVVRFDGQIDRSITYPYNHGIPSVRLKVTGTAAT